MALFDFLKKKEKKQLPLPPPPSPPSGFEGDFEPIRAFPEPEVPDFENVPSADYPEFPWPVEEKEVTEPMPELPEKAPWLQPAVEWVPKSGLPKPPVFERTLVEQKTFPPRTFIALDDYKKIIAETNSIRSRLVNADNYVKKLTEIKSAEERSLQTWHAQLEKLEKKMAYVDELIAQAKR